MIELELYKSIKASFYGSSKVSLLTHKQNQSLPETVSEDCMLLVTPYYRYQYSCITEVQKKRRHKI